MTATHRANSTPSKTRKAFSSFGSGLAATLSALGEASAASIEAANMASASRGLTVEADTVDQLLRFARLERGMTLETLGQLTGIRVYRLQRFEDEWSYATPSIDELIAIKAALNLSADSVRKFL